MKNWSSFSRSVRSKKLTLTEPQLANANRAYARFVLAKNFLGITAKDMSQRTLHAYSATLAVFLAYTAAEQVGKLTGTSVTNWRIDEPKVAARLRVQMTMMNESVNEHLTSAPLREALGRLMRNESNDVRVVATAIRVAVAHGSLTGTGASARTVSNRKALLELANLLLDESEKRFGVWFERSMQSTARARAE